MTTPKPTPPAGKTAAAALDAAIKNKNNPAPKQHGKPVLTVVSDANQAPVQDPATDVSPLDDLRAEMSAMFGGIREDFEAKLTAHMEKVNAAQVQIISDLIDQRDQIKILITQVAELTEKAEFLRTLASNTSDLESGDRKEIERLHSLVSSLSRNAVQSSDLEEERWRGVFNRVTAIETNAPWATDHVEQVRVLKAQVADIAKGMAPVIAEVKKSEEPAPQVREASIWDIARSFAAKSG